MFQEIKLNVCVEFEGFSSIAWQLPFTSPGHWAGIKIIADSETIKECIPAATDAVLKGKDKSQSA